MWHKKFGIACLLSAVLGTAVLGSVYLSQATVNEVTAANRYTANGSVADFAYTFRILTSADIEVLVDATVKTLNTDYTVTGMGDSTGGTVTLLVTPTADSVITLLRKQPASQLSDYVPNEPFPSTRLEKDFDKLVMLVQQLKEQLDRAWQFPKQSTLTKDNVDQPVEGSFARGKAGGGIDWATMTGDGAGGSIVLPLAIADGGTGAITAPAALTALGVSAYAKTLLDDADAATARSTLGITSTQADDVFRVTGSADATKLLAFEIDGFTTGTTRTVTIQNEDQTLVGRDTTDTLNNKTLTTPAINSGVLTTSTVAADPIAALGVASKQYVDGHFVMGSPTSTATGASSYTFSSIPSGVKHIVLSFVGVSLNGTDHYIVQLGDSGGLEGAGYSSISNFGNNAAGATIGTQTSSAGFAVQGGAAAATVTGTMTLTLVDSSTNTWVSTHTLFLSTNNSVLVGAGSKSLTGTLDRIALDTTGTNTFDAGKINIQYAY